MKITPKDYLAFLLFTLMLYSNISSAQINNVIKLYGKVVTAEALEALPFANVSIKGSSNGTVTRETGYFELYAFQDDSLVVNYVGYHSFTVKVGDLSTPQNLLIILKQKQKELEEVTIVTEKERIVRVTDNISSIKISPLLVAKLPYLGEVDIMKSFQLLPGVSATNETSSGLYVRGGTPDQNLILYDGMTIYHVDHFYGFFSAFNANAIDDIELMKGGFPAKYGGRTSSVMEITGKPADLKNVHGGGTLGLLSLNTFLELPIIKDKLSLQIAARRSYTDLIRSGLYNKIFKLFSEENEPAQQPMGRFTQETVEPKFHFYDLNSKITFKLNNKNTFNVSFFNSKDKLDNSRDMPTGRFGGFGGGGSGGGGGSITDIADWGNTGFSGNWINNKSENFNSSVFLSYSNYFSKRNRKTDIDPGTAGNVRPGMNTAEDNKLQDFSMRFRNVWKVNRMNTVEFGIEESFNKIGYSLVFNDTSNLVLKNDEGLQSSLYLQDKITLLNNKLTINAGLRSTHFNVTNKIYPEPRLSLIYEPFTKFKIKSAWGLYNQFLTRIIREDVLQGSKDFWLLSDDKSVAINSATHYIIGCSYDKNNYLFEIEGFYKSLKGLTEYSMRNTSNPMRRDPNEARQEYFFKGTGYSKGIEFLIQKKFGFSTGWIAYTLSEVKHTYPELNNGLPYYALHDQTHEFKAVFLRRIKSWDLSAAFIYATGKPYTAPESEYQITLLDGTVYNYIHVSKKNSYRLPDYHHLDVSASYNWKGVHTENVLSFSIFNVYNRKNVWYKEFDINESEVIVTDMNLLGFTPNISFSIKF